MNRAPVALFAYNRPVHTRKTVEALLQNEGAAETDLFVFSDGPRTPAADDAVRDIRGYVQALKGFHSITLVARPHNFGLAASVIDGVSRLCRERGQVIVVEDDLITSRHFLNYMNLGLEAYRDADSVMQVAGYMFPSTLAFPEDALFLPFPTSWGWGTWERAWKHFDPTGAGYDKVSGSEPLRRGFDLNGHFKYFALLKAQREGKRDSWAILWYLSIFLRQGLTLYPRRTLVRNIGFDGSGSNPFFRDFDQAQLDPEFRVKTLPPSVALAPESDAVIRGLPAPRLTLGSFWKKALHLFRK